jgi:hypothetical protein
MNSIYHFFKSYPGLAFLLPSFFIFFDGYRSLKEKQPSRVGFEWQALGVLLVLIGAWTSVLYKSWVSLVIVALALYVEISLMLRWRRKAPVSTN